jgi:hypothetical protein
MLTNNHGLKERSRTSTLIMVKKKDFQEIRLIQDIGVIKFGCNGRGNDIDAYK